MKARTRILVFVIGGVVAYGLFQAFGTVQTLMAARRARTYHPRNVKELTGATRSELLRDIAHGVTVLEISAGWCVWCKYEQKELDLFMERQFHGRKKFYVCETDDRRNRDLLRQLEKQGLLDYSWTNSPEHYSWFQGGIPKTYIFSRGKTIMILGAGEKELELIRREIREGAGARAP